MAENEEEDFTILRQDWTSLPVGSRYCVWGAKKFCAQHGYPYRVFLREGVKYSRVKHIKHPLLNNVIENARKRIAAKTEGA